MGILDGQVALVTGAGRGFGRAIAESFAAEGAAVALLARSLTQLDEVARAILAGGGHAIGVRCDVTDAASVAHAVAKTEELLGPVDLLVNNAGIPGPFGPIWQVDPDEWWRAQAVHIRAPMLFLHHVLPGMIERGWGRVLFLSSESALNIPADMIHYGFTKTAALAISRGLAKRVAGSGVTVNAILPGPTLSEGLRAMVAEGAAAGGRSIEDEARAFVMTHRPSSIIQRAATPEEVANLIVYVASPQASATTGASLRVDGGVVETIA